MENINSLKGFADIVALDSLFLIAPDVTFVGLTPRGDTIPTSVFTAMSCLTTGSGMLKYVRGSDHETHDLGMPYRVRVATVRLFV